VFTGGYRGRLLRINLTDESYGIESISEGLYKKYLGGRGLAAYYYCREIAGGTDPLSPENKLFFFTGPLTGLPLPATTKFQCATRSPETGQYLCSNSSGTFGPYLKQSGFDGLIIEGKASKPLYLAIENDLVEFRNAEALIDLKTGQAMAAISEEWPKPKLSIMTAGPAAFNGVRLANIMVGDRSFGRGGAGAVMAAKNLKALAVNGGGEIPVADPQRIKELNKKAAREARKTRQGHNLYGTNQYTEVMNELGCYSVRNFTTSVFEGIDTISKDYVTEHHKEKSLACFHCPVACAQLYSVDDDGAFKGISSDPEYETVGTLGALCGVSDFNAIIAGNYYCDEYGIDTMSAGNLIAYAMECFEKGIFNTNDTGGVELRFGNGQAMVEMIKQMGEKRGFGAILGRGFRELAALYPDTVYYMMHVKWMPFAAYDPRGFFGMGLAFGTSSRGACHNVGGWTIREELLKKTYDRFALKGKGELVKKLQDNRAYIDSLGICTVVRGTLDFSDQPGGDVLAAATGMDLTPELMSIGERIILLERLILNREGISRADDYLPPRIMTEPLPEGPARDKVITREMYDVMLEEYYRLRGWDHNGIPGREVAEQLGVEIDHCKG